jgi:hypothetical protein
VCGLNEQQQNAVLGEGFPDMMSFCSMNHSSLSEMVMDDEITLSKFKDTFTGYVQWEVELINYLSGLKGKSGVPLVYVICK